MAKKTVTKTKGKSRTVRKTKDDPVKSNRQIIQELITAKAETNFDIYTTVHAVYKEQEWQNWDNPSTGEPYKDWGECSLATGLHYTIMKLEKPLSSMASPKMT